MNQAFPALLSLLVATMLLGADTPAPSGHAPVRDEAWMNERPSDNKKVYSGQQLDTVGQLVDVPGRILAIEFARSGKILLVKTTTVLASLDAATMQVIQKAEYPIAKAGGSMHGLAVAADGASALVSGGRTHLYQAKIAEDGQITWGPSIDISGGAKNVNPLGLALSADGKQALVALSMANQLAMVDLTHGKVVATVGVGVCPYGVALSADGKTAYVSNFGGNAPGAEDLAEASGGSMVAVDKAHSRNPAASKSACIRPRSCWTRLDIASSSRTSAATASASWTPPNARSSRPWTPSPTPACPGACSPTGSRSPRTAGRSTSSVRGCA